MDTPLAGGMNRLASAAQVYNEIAATRPDLIKVLAADDWPFENKYAYVLDPLYVFQYAALLNMESLHLLYILHVVQSTYRIFSSATI